MGVCWPVFVIASDRDHVSPYIYTRYRVFYSSVVYPSILTLRSKCLLPITHLLHLLIVV